MIFSSAYSMEPNFKKQKRERRIAYNKPYTQQDKEKLTEAFLTIAAGTVIASTGCALQKPITIGFGLGLVIGGTDDIQKYYKFDRRYSQK